MSQDGPSLKELIGLGSAIAGLVIVGTALGWFLDSRFGTSPLLTLIGVALGIILACAYTYAVFRKFMEK
jgi:F0F1-type ATP synthase assembly protein I